MTKDEILYGFSEGQAVVMNTATRKAILCDGSNRWRPWDWREAYAKTATKVAIDPTDHPKPAVITERFFGDFLAQRNIPLPPLDMLDEVTRP
jgi:hypothetical protein